MIRDTDLVQTQSAARQFCRSASGRLNAQRSARRCGAREHARGWACPSRCAGDASPEARPHHDCRQARARARRWEARLLGNGRCQRSRQRPQGSRSRSAPRDPSVATPIEQVSALVRRFSLIPDHMCERGFADRTWKVRAFLAPVPKRAAESVRRQRHGKAWLRLARARWNGNAQAPGDGLTLSRAGNVPARSRGRRSVAGTK